MIAFLKFMSSSTGRLARIVAGVAIIGVGLWLGGAGGVVVAVIGVVPLAAGAFDFCVFAPLAGKPFAGKGFRAQASGR